jgi:hypothetical protein
MDVRRDVDGIGLDQTFLYMTVYCIALRLFLLACLWSRLALHTCQITSDRGDTAKNCSFVLFLMMVMVSLLNDSVALLLSVGLMGRSVERR